MEDTALDRIAVFSVQRRVDSCHPRFAHASAMLRCCIYGTPPTHPPSTTHTGDARARLHAHPHPRAARARKSTADSVCERTPVLYTRSHALSLSRATHRKPVHWSGVSSQEPPLPSGSILMPKQQPGDAGKALPTRINVLALAQKTRERWARAHAPHPLVSLLPHTQRICTALHCAVSCTLTHLITRRSAPLRAVP